MRWAMRSASTATRASTSSYRSTPPSPGTVDDATSALASSAGQASIAGEAVGDAVFNWCRDQLARDLQREKDSVLKHAHLVTSDGRTADPAFTGRVVKAVEPPAWIRVVAWLAAPYM